MLSPAEIEYVIKYMNEDAKRPDFNVESLKGRYWARLRKSVNTKFARRPELTPNMFNCALDNAKGIQEAFENTYLEAAMNGMMTEEQRAGEQEEQGVSESFKEVGLGANGSPNGDDEE